jgi:hypothetical protein
MPVGGSDLGLLPPAGTALDMRGIWFDGPLQVRSGASLTANTGSTVALNGTTTISGTFSVNPPTINGTSWNDTTEVISPSSYGLIAYNYPYLFATGTGSAVTTAGRLYLAKVPLAAGTVVTNLWFSIATAAATPTTGQNFGGVFNSAGTLVATTADLTTTIGTNTGAIQAALTAPYTVPSGGNYYVGFFFNASTQPVLTCYTGQVTVTTSVANFGSATTFGNTAAKYPFAVSATTGNTTAMPATITMASNTATGAYTFWTGIN